MLKITDRVVWDYLRRGNVLVAHDRRSEDEEKASAVKDADVMRLLNASIFAKLILSDDDFTKLVWRLITHPSECSRLLCFK